MDKNMRECEILDEVRDFIVSMDKKSGRKNQ